MTDTPNEKSDSTGPGPVSILYLCAMNAIRSPMAEYLTRDLFGDRVYAKSAGVRVGEVSGFAVSAMAERGIDMSGHHPILFEDLGDDYFDLIVTLSPEAHHKAMDQTRTDATIVEYWPTEDPSTVAGNREQVLQAYAKVRDFIEANVKRKFGD